MRKRELIIIGLGCGKLKQELRRRLCVGATAELPEVQYTEKFIYLLVKELTFFRR